jgi:hypothetical protein
MVRGLVRAQLALVASLAALSFGCASTLEEAPLCARPGACAAGYSCVLGKCRTPAPPTPADASRYVLAPVDLAVVASSARGGGGDSLPESVTLGRASNGTVELLFRFEAAWKDDADVASAFLVLAPVEGANLATEPLIAEAAKIVDAWDGSTVTWGRSPRLGLSQVVSTARPRPNAALRVDVTSLVRRWGHRDKDDHGLALVVRGADAFGVAYALGGGQGLGPKLEVYVR